MTNGEKTKKLNTLGTLRYIANLSTISAALVFVVKYTYGISNEDSTKD